MKIKMDNDLRLLGLNFSALGISFTEIELILQYILLVLSIVLSIFKLFKSNKKDNDNGMGK